VHIIFILKAPFYVFVQNQAAALADVHMPPVPMAEDLMQDDDHEYESDADEDEMEDWDSDDEFHHPLSDVPCLDDEIVPGGVTKGEILILMFDWMASNKEKDKSAEDVWNMMKAMLPPEAPLATFNELRAVLLNHMNKTVTKVHYCPNCCITAYHDCVSPDLHWHQHSGLDKCPRPECGGNRYIENEKGELVPRAVFYYLPLGNFVRDLFNQADLVPFLLQDMDKHTHGSVQRSRGWKAKVTDNPKMNKDTRNLSFILSTDGVPYFKYRGCRSGWPFVLRVANLPDGLWNEMSYVHMCAFMASDYLVKDPITRKLKPHQRYTGYYSVRCCQSCVRFRYYSVRCCQSCVRCSIPVYVVVIPVHVMTITVHIFADLRTL
jgi:hypothetical protein